MFGVNFAENQDNLYNFKTFLKQQSISDYHPIIILYILILIGTMNFTDTYNVFLEYNVSSKSHKKSIFGFGLLGHHTKSFF